MLRNVLTRAKLHIIDRQYKDVRDLYKSLEVSSAVIYSFLNVESFREKVKESFKEFKVTPFNETRIILFEKDSLFKKGIRYLNFLQVKYIDNGKLLITGFNINSLNIIQPMYSVVYDSQTKKYSNLTYIQRDSISEDKWKEWINSNTIVVLCFLFSLTMYEVEEKTLSVSDRMKHKISKTSLPLYTEYTLDISKPKVVYTNNTSLGGTHASPREHYRREHIRRYKSGKVVTVKGHIINQGSEAGKIYKEYQLA